MDCGGLVLTKKMLDQVGHDKKAPLMYPKKLLHRGVLLLWP